MSYTSEDLTALPKIAERLRNNMPHNHIGDPAGLGDPILYCTSCCERREAASALLKAHAEIVRLQAIEERAKRVQHNFRPWLDDPMRDVDNTLGTLLRYIIEEPESRLEGK